MTQVKSSVSIDLESAYNQAKFQERMDKRGRSKSNSDGQLKKRHVALSLKTADDIFGKENK